MEKVYAKAILFALPSVLFLASIAYADGNRFEETGEVYSPREIIFNSDAIPEVINDFVLDEEPEKVKLIFNNSYDESEFFDFEEFEFSPGQKIQLTAEPNSGYFFSHWSVDGTKISETATLDYIMPSKDVNLVGHFVKILEPKVQILSPNQNASFISNETVLVNVNAESPNGKVTKVELFRNGTLVGSVAGSPNNISFTLSNMTVGSYKLTAKVQDDKGASSVSAPVDISIVPPNVLPTVEIISPKNGNTFIEGQDIKIDAIASDTDGKITKVEFFRGGTLVGTSISSPYSVVWPKAVAGSYSLTAVAYDNVNAKTTSVPVKIEVVKQNATPVVKITSPTAGSNFTEGANIKIEATATDSDGKITKVEFYRGTTLVGTSTVAPYTVTWSNAVAGSYNLTAKAFDDKGASTTSSIVGITVNKANTAPAVSITSPTAGASFTEGANIKIEATATDSDGKITKVEFYRGSTLIGTSTVAPFTVTWTNAVAGSFNLTAKAFDDKGASTTSSTVGITVNKANTAPAVSITSPTAGASFTEGVNIKIEATATDSDGKITKVEFYRGSTLIGTSTVAPFTVTWSNAVAGSYNLTAKAFDDKGASTTSSTVGVTVNKANTTPAVSITSPTAGASFTEGVNIKIEAAATDSDGKITKVEFYGGSTLIGTSTVAPFTVTWTNAVAGSYNLTAKAFDDKGASTTSSTVGITVNKANTAPAVSITSPTAGASFTEGSNIKIEATATDSDGKITKVEFYRGSTLIGTSTVAPYTVTWSNAILGNHSITAKAFDDKGASTLSAVIGITVIKANQIPVVKITSPATGTNFMEGSNIKIEADATDSDGKITKVEFYRGTTLIGSSTVAPYAVTWSNAIAGNHSLTAKAFDEKSGIATSSPVSVTVTPVVALPEISLITPIENQVFEVGSNVSFTVMFNGNSSSVKKVSYYVDEVLIGTSTQSPFNVVWKSTSPGQFKVKAMATGGDPEKTNTSEFVNITVDPVSPIKFDIVSPVKNATFKKGENIEIKVDVPVSSKRIVRVDYFRGNILLGSNSVQPYSFVWNNVNIGAYNLVARLVYDDGSSLLSSVVNVTVEENKEPKVLLNYEISSKGNKKSADILFGVSFQNLTETISSVEYYLDGVLIGKSERDPYSFTRRNVQGGIYQASAKAIDIYGYEFWSENVQVEVSGSIGAKTEEETSVFNYTIGPNPTTDYLNVYFEEVEGDQQIEIYLVAMKGNFSKTYSAVVENKTLTLDVTDLISGNYVLYISIQGMTVQSKKFIKK